jgi:hypothetical protein
MVLLEKVVEAEDLACATSKENYKSFLEILTEILETWVGEKAQDYFKVIQIQFKDFIINITYTFYHYKFIVIVKMYRFWNVL